MCSITKKKLIISKYTQFKQNTMQPENETCRDPFRLTLPLSLSICQGVHSTQPNTVFSSPSLHHALFATYWSSVPRLIHNFCHLPLPSNHANVWVQQTCFQQKQKICSFQWSTFVFGFSYLPCPWQKTKTKNTLLFVKLSKRQITQTEGGRKKIIMLKKNTRQ